MWLVLAIAILVLAAVYAIHDMCIYLTGGGPKKEIWTAPKNLGCRCDCCVEHQAKGEGRMEQGT